MDSSQRIEALVTWATSHGAHLNPSIQVVSLPQTGLSFCATNATASNDTIVSIPSSLTFSYLNALPGGDRGDPRPFPASFLAQTPPHVVARFLLAKHFLLGYKSFWGPYIQALPQPEDEDSWSLPQFWPDEDAELFDGTNLDISVAEIRTNVKREFRDAVVILTSESWEPELVSKISLSLYQWAYSIISSRSFRSSLVLSEEDQQRLPEGVSMGDFSVLMPLFDVGNHDMTAHVKWELDEASKSCSLRVAKAYKPGEQVFNNYSMKTNAELLLGYGFMLPQREGLHNDYIHVRKRQEDGGGPAMEEYYISLRPVRHASSLLARSKQDLQLSESTQVLGAFQHIQHAMVWDIFCTITPAEQRTEMIPIDDRLQGEAAEQARQEKFFSGQVSEEGLIYVQQTAAIIQNKVLRDLERLQETDVEVVSGDLTRNQKLALDYRARCRQVLENTLEAMDMEGLTGEDEEEH
ncbi:hypothetical protein ACJ41O_006971 [Fusarium nematophilum]